MKTTTLLIVDDHTLVRETWSYILNTEPGLCVVGETGSAEDAIGMAGRLRPDIVLMDINLQGMSGIEAVPLIRRCSPATKVLGVSLHTQPVFARKMMQQGATGYVTKTSSREEMLFAIRELKQGRKYVCQEIKNILSEQVFSRDDDHPGDINALTARETEIIARIKMGASSRDIAGELGLSIKTIDVHRSNILRKLKLKNTAALINFITRSPQEPDL